MIFIFQSDASRKWCVIHYWDHNSPLNIVLSVPVFGNVSEITQNIITTRVTTLWIYHSQFSHNLKHVFEEVFQNHTQIMHHLQNGEEKKYIELQTDVKENLASLLLYTFHYSSHETTFSLPTWSHLTDAIAYD